MHDNKNNYIRIYNNADLAQDFNPQNFPITQLVYKNISIF